VLPCNGLWSILKGENEALSHEASQAPGSQLSGWTICAKQLEAVAQKL
jgi:hypothetical protein